MLTFLNIAILIVGSAATLAAFGGKTWSEGTEPVLKRITERGWISIFCLVLALALGAAKELLTQKEEADKKAAAVRESAAGLITALANTDQKMRTIVLYLPFTSRSRSSLKFSDALLPRFPNEACAELTGVNIALLVNTGLEAFLYDPSDDAHSHHNFNVNVPNADEMLHITDPDVLSHFHDLNEDMGQSSWNQYAYIAELHVPSYEQSAASFLSAVMRKDSVPIAIQMRWPADALMANDKYEGIAQRYKYIFGIKPGEMERPHEPGKHDLNDRYPFPADCSALVSQYFSKAFDKALITVLLKQKTNGTISFHLKADSPTKRYGEWMITFHVIGTPIIEADNSGQDILGIDWPDEK